jgi:RNA polymerase sigma-70 factor (ECF subfamily)
MVDPGNPNTIADGVSADPQWLAELYANHRAGLRRFLIGVVRDANLADDLVQVTFAKASTAGDTVRPQAIKAWLYRVAFNEAMTWKRRERVDREAKRRQAEEPDRHAAAPDEALVRRELVEQVRQALGQLSEAQQLVLRLRIYEEMTFAEIAAQTGKPLGTVLTHMRRGLEKLRQKLKRQE